MNDFTQKYGNCLAVLGLQWGDEGKGKLVDILAEQYDIIVRANGGANAGHTINFEVDGEKKKIVFHLLPSGILQEGKVCVIGNGCVVDVAALKQEIEDLKNIDLNGRLFISDRAQIVFGYHKVIDGIHEELKGAGKVGTTMRGIGPAYADKINRINLRVGDLTDFNNFEEKYKAALELHKKVYGNIGENSEKISNYDAEAELNQYKKLADYFKGMIINTSYYLNKALDTGKNILLEGANGSLLDIDHGTYPFVTSSNTTLGGICAGCGIAPKKITHTIGILKAYTTRVGEGPFPTELNDDTGKKMQEVGNEFGSTTGRGRRCGWFDGVAAKYSCMINGVDSINLTKIDVLNDFSTIKICEQYEINGEKTSEFKSNIAELQAAEPKYQELPGWQKDLENSSIEALPENCKKYIKKIEEITGTKVDFIGTGPDRSQMIVV